jgi:hypothetical protein
MVILDVSINNIANVSLFTYDIKAEIMTYKLYSTSVSHGIILN